MVVSLSGMEKALDQSDQPEVTSRHQRFFSLLAARLRRIVRDPKQRDPDNWRKYLRIRNVLLRNLLSEFFATALLRFIGTGGMVGFIVGSNSLLQVNLTWGFAVTFAVYSTWKTSGGHINPAITAILFALGKISLFHSVLYCIAQVLGAAVGAGLSYAVYYDAINSFDNGTRSVVGESTSTGAIFASFPMPFLTNTNAFFDQIAGTGIMGFFTAFFCEHRNQIPVYLMPSFFGIIASMISLCYGLNMGSPVNPATDFGSRSVAAIFGYGAEMFTYHNYFFWIPIVAPMVGALVGTYLYIFFIGLHVPDLDEKQASSR